MFPPSFCLMLPVLCVLLCFCCAVRVLLSVRWGVLPASCLVPCRSAAPVACCVSLPGVTGCYVVLFACCAPRPPPPRP